MVPFITRPIFSTFGVTTRCVPRGWDATTYGCVVLGCVIRGETSHYDIVCNNANHWLMHVAVANAVPLGNAILTVDTEAQALERARGGRKGKGADAVRACLAVVAIDRAFADEEVP